LNKEINDIPWNRCEEKGNPLSYQVLAHNSFVVKSLRLTWNFSYGNAEFNLQTSLAAMMGEAVIPGNIYG
jgi:hypothetical protein